MKNRDSLARKVTSNSCVVDTRLKKVAVIFRVLRRALDDGYFGQPDNEEVVTKENDFISCACVCRMT